MSDKTVSKRKIRSISIKLYTAFKKYHDEIGISIVSKKDFDNLAQSMHFEIYRF